MPEDNVGKLFQWRFDEFEVDVANDGTCLDEVYIFTPQKTLGPYCGFDNGMYKIKSDISKILIKY